MAAYVVHYYFSLFHFDDLGSACQVLKPVAKTSKHRAKVRL